MRRLVSILAWFIFAGVCLFLYAILGPPGAEPRSARVRGDFNSIGAALKTYKIDTGFYPSTEQGLRALVESPKTEPTPKRWNKIADRVPTDPWTREYRYRLLPEDDPRGYELRTAGPDGTDGNEDDFSSLE